MKLIASAILTSAQANIQFTSITNAYDDLIIFMSLRNSADNAGGTIAFNTGGTYTRRRLLAVSTTITTDTAAVDYQVNTSVSTANIFSNGSLYIPNYAGSTQKPYSSSSGNENNATTASNSLIAGLWNQTAAITQITLTPGAGNFVAGSEVTLYGITRGSDGIVTVT
jgi:hypothetical protein